jgi:hypothetical protein
MPQFIIIELEDGLTVVELQLGQLPEDAATTKGGTLIDPGPYASFEEADDALLNLQAEELEERE